MDEPKGISDYDIRALCSIHMSGLGVFDGPNAVQPQVYKFARALLALAGWRERVCHRRRDRQGDTMRRFLVVSLVLTFGLFVLAALLVTHGGGQPVPVPKYPPVPDEEFLKDVIPDPKVDDGKIRVCIQGNGEHLGSTLINDVDFAVAPTWAKQAAIAKAETDIATVYNATVAQVNATQDAQEASAAYVKFCYDCGGCPGCCYWDCHGVPDPPYNFCIDYRQGSCVTHKYLCPPQPMTQCGFCDYVDPP